MSGNVNVYRGIFNDTYTHGNYIWAGHISTHDNGQEDRLFQLRYCIPNLYTTPYTETYDLSETNTQVLWTRECNSNSSPYEGIISANSYYVTSQFDRKWTFKCGKLHPDMFLTDCQWSGYVNGYELSYFLLKFFMFSFFTAFCYFKHLDTFTTCYI